MTEPTRALVCTDASVLVNLAILDGFSLLAALPAYRFVVPDTARAEVIVAEQREVLDTALADGHLTEVTFETPEELRLFAELSAQVDPGEAACLAIAIARDGFVACDERGAFARITRERLGPDRTFTTPGLILEAIRAGVIDVKAADECKVLLEKHRFRMRFASFRDLLP